MESSLDKIITVHCHFHLGDNIFNFILFYNIKQYIEENNIIIYYYLKSEYLKQVSEFNISKNILLFDLNELTLTSNHMWIGDNTIQLNYFQAMNNRNLYNNLNKFNYNDFYILWYNSFLKQINIPSTISSSTYSDIELLNRYEQINNKYKNIDILILNSQPFSGQYNYNKDEWDIYITKMNTNYNILTTTKVHNINCTIDDNLTVKSIAAISTNVKIIIAVNSGVIVGLFNEYTLKNVKQFFIFDKTNSYSYDKFQNINNINDITNDILDHYLEQS